MALRQETPPEIPETCFSWVVSHVGYYWDAEAEQKPMDDFSEVPKRRIQGPFLLMHPDTTELHGHFFLEETTKLFAIFAETLTTEERVLAFANKYGMLNGLGETLIITRHYSHRKGERATYSTLGCLGIACQKGDMVYGVMRAESLSLWTGEILYMRWTLQLWEWLYNEGKRTSDWRNLSRVIQWHPTEDAVAYFLANKEVLSRYKTVEAAWNDIANIKKREEPYIKGHILLKNVPEGISRSFKRSSRREPAQYLLQKRIYDKLEEHGSNPRLLWKDGALSSYLMPNSLLGAMWLQFYGAAM